MKIALIQTNPQADFESNLKKSLEYVHKAAKMGAHIVVLPETFLFMGHENERRLTWQKCSDQIMDQFKILASNLNIYLVAGSFDEISFDNSLSNAQQNNHGDEIQERVYNTCYTFSPKGHLIAQYRKLHLFNLFDENNESVYCESDVYKFGVLPKPYQIKINDQIWNAFNMICYDLRFPEIVRYLNATCDIIFVPSAFTWQTGRDHWEILLRARAIENQCFVVACNQTGYSHDGQKRCYGHSMVVDPWGKIIASLEEQEDILLCEISYNDLDKNRLKLPALRDRKIFVSNIHLG
jgi:predicted amidohydrolase